MLMDVYPFGSKSNFQIAYEESVTPEYIDETIADVSKLLKRIEAMNGIPPKRDGPHFDPIFCGSLYLAAAILNFLAEAITWFQEHPFSTYAVDLRALTESRESGETSS